MNLTTPKTILTGLSLIAWRSFFNQGYTATHATSTGSAPCFGSRNLKGGSQSDKDRFN
jgi:hypothetical protein